MIDTCLKGVVSRCEPGDDQVGSIPLYGLYEDMLLDSVYGFYLTCVKFYDGLKGLTVNRQTVKKVTVKNGKL